LSGGTDSSLAGYILKKQGYNVEAVFLDLWAGFTCQSAQKTADKLGIKLNIIKARKFFEKQVVSYFVNEYKKGRTPNPCVVCNEKIKFGLLFDYIKKNNFDYLASGHYVRLIKKNKQIFLCRGKDKLKDQSYFLWNINKHNLPYLIFPLGNTLKSDNKKKIKQLGLPINTKESMNICFLHNDLKSFLRNYIKLKPGPIINMSGEKLGTHQGLALYTIGQRCGLGGGLYWVVKIDNKKNTLIASADEDDLYKKSFTVEKWHWFKKPPDKVLVQIRYGHNGVPGQIKNRHVIFKRAQRAITPGQSAVVYDKANRILLGGGVIK